MNRNTKGLQQTNQQKRLDAFAKVERAIKQLSRQQLPINFESVAKAAGVSRSWLYKQPDLKERILHLREQQTSSDSPPIKASDSSKDAMIRTLRQQVQQTNQENTVLLKRIEVAYGLAYQAAPEALAAENQQLTQETEELKLKLNQSLQDNQVWSHKNQQLHNKIREMQAQLIAMEALDAEIVQLKKQNQHLFKKLMQLESAECSKNSQKIANDKKQEPPLSDWSKVEF
ncbi:DUF6262 family protein [Acaryochloris sp. CCMEE 5410]|uniref:DUF6262 family protein n=1 Tax=Acaryochloris sp. CCMEE 5410 TaxID=310037 RepID=UPI0002484167|nr:DUF6262 family protein [Acaryochloris sp. CCMEE 5410]KAI9129804.1 hypothetical protein ON05_032260 [Acaryochloris sp. CCMEE 5410]